MLQANISELWQRVLVIKSINAEYHASKLLFISYKFVKGFFAITFWLLVISNWNSHDVRQRFLYNQEKRISWIWQKMRSFPIEPHYKNLWGKSLSFVGSSWNYMKWTVNKCLTVLIVRWDRIYCIDGLF